MSSMQMQLMGLLGANALGQIPSNQQPTPSKPPELPPRPDPLETDKALKESLEKLVGFGPRGIADYHKVVTKGALTQDTPYPRGKEPEQITNGRTGVGAVTYRKEIDYYDQAFAKLREAKDGLFTPPGASFPLFSRAKDPGAFSTGPDRETKRDCERQTFGQITDSADRQAVFRKQWVDWRMKAYEDALDETRGQVKDMVGHLKSQPYWSKFETEADGSLTRRNRRPVLREGGSTAEQEFEASATTSKKQLRAALEARFDMERTAWVKTETTRLRHELATETVMLIGDPKMATPKTPSTALPQVEPGTYVLEQNGTKVHLRRDANSGIWTWGQPDPGTGKVPDGKWFPSTNAIEIRVQDKPAEIAVKTAINRELSYLSTPQPSHYVIQVDNETLHARFVKDSSGTGGVWQWGEPKQKGSDVFDASGEVPSDQWKPFGTTTKIISDTIKKVFASAAERESTPVARIAEEYQKLEQEVRTALPTLRQKAIDRALVGVTGESLGFKPAEIDFGAPIGKKQGWTLTEGGTEVQVVRPDPNGPYEYRFRQRVDLTNAQDAKVFDSTAAAWSPMKRLPAGEMVEIPKGTAKDGKDPSADGLRAIENKLRRIGNLERATSLGIIREWDADAVAGAASAFERGPSFDPADSMLRLTFGAKPAGEAYGPGVYELTRDGKTVLLRRLAATDPSGRPLPNTTPGFGQWEFADVPQSPGEGKPAPAPSWKSVHGDPQAPGKLGGVQEVLLSFNYTEPYSPWRLHPIAERAYSSVISTADREARRKSAGEAFLNSYTASYISPDPKNRGIVADRNNAVPVVSQGNGYQIVQLPGTSTESSLHVRHGANGWEVRRGNNPNGPFVRAGDDGSFIPMPSSSAGGFLQLQQANQIVTVLADLNRGVGHNQTLEDGKRLLDKSFAKPFGEAKDNTWSVSLSPTVPQLRVRFNGNLWQVTLDGNTWATAGAPGGLIAQVSSPADGRVNDFITRLAKVNGTGSAALPPAKK